MVYNLKYLHSLSEESKFVAKFTQRPIQIDLDDHKVLFVCLFVEFLGGTDPLYYVLTSLEVFRSVCMELRAEGAQSTKFIVQSFVFRSVFFNEDLCFGIIIVLATYWKLQLLNELLFNLFLIIAETNQSGNNVRGAYGYSYLFIGILFVLDDEKPRLFDFLESNIANLLNYFDLFFSQVQDADEQS